MPTRGENGPAIVTGGAGAIGSVLVRALRARGEPLHVLDNLSSGRREFLPEDPKITLSVVDLRTPDAFAWAFEGATSVWHLAANTDIRLGTTNPATDFEHGTAATFNVLEAARRFDVPRIFFSSSSVVYGFPSTFPTPEGYGPLLPESHYGASKLACEALLSAYAHSYGLQAYIFRFANIIGPHMTHGVLVDFFRKLRADPSRLEVLGDGHQSKSYLRSEDCVGAMLTAADRAKGRVNIFNLGTRDRTSVREIAEKVVAAHGNKARIEYTGGDRGWVGDIPQQLLAVDRIEELGWRPASNSSEAVDKTIRELLAHGPGG